ncbi:YciI family protein [Nocardioides cynanchi]|uniref:YciI family protein n=1 Tax=Nocardioides cynanchi TaxID=2558918 RepID=UPI0012456F01|nr:YciI family protein [Nocardioides cynanchi]
MTEYLITANEEWVPDYSEERMEEMSQAVKELRAEMKAAGVYVFLGGLDNSAPVFSVDATSGSPIFTDGPYTETKEHLGGFTIIDVPDEEAARMWAAKVATACLWPHEVHTFQVPRQAGEG